MQIREYTESDLNSLRLIHAAQNFPYAFPDLNNPLFLTKIVLTDSGPDPSSSSGLCSESPSANGEPQTANVIRDMETLAASAARIANSRHAIRGAAFLRLTAEAYLLLDPQLKNPRDRWSAVLALHAAAQHDAQRRGLEDVHAWLPPAIATKFGRRLTKLGWRRDDHWTPYCKRFYE